MQELGYVKISVPINNAIYATERCKFITNVHKFDDYPEDHHHDFEIILTATYLHTKKKYETNIFY